MEQRLEQLAHGVERRLARIEEQRGGRAGGGRVWHPHTNATHARAVAEAAGQLAAAWGLTDDEQALLRLAGAWHVTPLVAEGPDDVGVIEWLRGQPRFRDSGLVRDWTQIPIDGMCCVGEAKPRALPGGVAGMTAVLADAERAEWAEPNGAWTWLLLVAQRLRPASAGWRQYHDLGSFRPKRADVVRELRAGVEAIGGGSYVRPEAERLWGLGRKRTGVLLADLLEQYEAGASFWDVLEMARAHAPRNDRERLIGRTARRSR
jgi:hypothetical protein